jgi:hypothetical protein
VVDYHRGIVGRRCVCFEWVFYEPETEWRSLSCPELGGDPAEEESLAPDAFTAIEPVPATRTSERLSLGPFVMSAGDSRQGIGGSYSTVSRISSVLMFFTYAL